MGQKSSIARLDPRLKEAVDKAVREGRATIDEIVAAVLSMGGEVSRSAVGRYTKSAREKMKVYRQAQELASVWVKKMEEQPDGDVGRMNVELLRTVAFQAVSILGEREAEEVKPNEIMLLARAIKDLASADKTSTDRELRVRREVAAKAAGKIEALEKDVAKGSGQLTPEALKRVRQEIYGIAV